MKVLVVGGGGREHALAWRIARSPRVQCVHVAPGNGGTAREPDLVNVPFDGSAEAIAQLAQYVRDEGIAFTVVGPEAPLASGIVDTFRAAGLRIFGPTQACARLESSKDFAKAFMKRHGIPTAEYQTFADAAAARAYIAERGAPIVVKADGLAAGKGVVVAQTVEEAQAAVDMMLLDNRMGDAGARVVIEDFLEGEEASFIVMADGRNVLALATSQDHKRLLDGDEGPNTGGMGAYSPAPVVTPDIHRRVMREIIQPVLAGMAAEGTPYTGFLYAGLMIAPDGSVKTLEFNCRMGDPETQPIMARLKTDLTLLVEAAIDGRLDKMEAEWDRRTALGVVLAAGGYPDAPRKGDVIEGLPGTRGTRSANAFDEDTHVFHAGTAMQDDGKVVTTGGRVLCVTSLGDSVKEAQGKAYAAVDRIRFEGMQYRRDIGFRAVKR